MKKIFLLFIVLLSISVQSQTIQEVKNLISTNLASGTKITAEKHREVENAIVSLIEKKIFLLKGSVVIGDVAGNKTTTVSFSNVGTTNYMINGSLVSLSGNYLQDIQHTWMIRNKTSTSFQVVVSEMGGETSNLNFDYVIIPF
jgi:hypothetical protein